MHGRDAVHDSLTQDAIPRAGASRRRARGTAGRDAGRSKYVGELAHGTGNDVWDEEQPVKWRVCATRPYWKRQGAWVSLFCS